jgi:chemotaxis protein MotB
MALNKKCKCPPPGAPDWMVTYGDMVTLLLTFFVLLFTFMKPKEEEHILQLLEALRQQFGFRGGDMTLPTDEVFVPKNMPWMTVLQIPIYPHDLSPTEDEGLRAQRPKVTSIREADHFEKGGRMMFPELSAELSPADRKRLAEYATTLRGHTFMIEIRGHTSKRPVDGTPFANHFDLAYQRAEAVADVLVQEGIEAERLLITAAGTARPVTRRAYDQDERKRNDLVEILQLDQTVTDFE